MYHPERRRRPRLDIEKEEQMYRCKVQSKRDAVMLRKRRIVASSPTLAMDRDVNEHPEMVAQLRIEPLHHPHVYLFKDFFDFTVGNVP